MEKNNFCTFYIIRHGETDWNILRKIQGHIDVPINKKGEFQAKELGQKLKDIHFDAAFSSDLVRARRTTELIFLEKKLAIQTTKALRERYLGKWEGRSFEAFKDIRKTVDRYKALVEKGLKMNEFEGIETDDGMISRLLTFLREVAVAYRGKTVLVGTHGGVMRILLNHLKYFGDDIFEGRIHNTSYILLESDGVDFFVKETVGIDIPFANEFAQDIPI